MSLTITSYLVIQGISPLIWGPLSDIVGRRPIYICSFSVYIAANIVLALSPNFPVLLVFRGLQSAGSASTVSIGKWMMSLLFAGHSRDSETALVNRKRRYSGYCHTNREGRFYWLLPSKYVSPMVRLKFASRRYWY